MSARVGLAVACLATLVSQRPPKGWVEFHDETLGIAFHHPSTKGLRYEAREATCTYADRIWSGGVPDSMVVVTRTAARLEPIAAYLGIVRANGSWVAEGYQGSRAPVAVVRTGGWEAFVATEAVTVVYDEVLRSSAKARQWRLVAMGPATDGCRPLIVSIATGMSMVWDSAAVVGVLESARLRH